MSVTGELPRQLIFSGVHFEKQTETNELTDKPETKCVKRIKFMKLFKILGIKLSEERPGEVSVCLVATSSPLRRSVPPLETGDVLISINGTAVTSKRQAEKLLSSLEKGEHSIQAVSPPAQQDASILKEEHQENTEVNKNSSQTQQIVTPNKQLNSFQVELVARNKQDLFGLEFEETNNNICVKSIQTNSPAFECKQIQVGDRILTIDRNLFVEISSRDADRIYENLPLNKPILFTFERGTGTVGVPRVVIPRKLSFRDRIIEVDLQRGGDNKLGVVLSGGEDTNEKRVYIRRIGPNSIVSTDGRLKVCCCCYLFVVVLLFVIVLCCVVVIVVVLCCYCCYCIVLLLFLLLLLLLLLFVIVLCVLLLLLLFCVVIVLCCCCFCYCCCFVLLLLLLYCVVIVVVVVIVVIVLCVLCCCYCCCFVLLLYCVVVVFVIVVVLCCCCRYCCYCIVLLLLLLLLLLLFRLEMSLSRLTTCRWKE